MSETASPDDWYGAPVDEELVRVCAHNLLAAVDEAIYFKDPEGRFILISRGQALRLGAGSPAEVVGNTDLDYFGPEHTAKSRADEDEVFRTGKPLVNSLEQIAFLGDHPRWVTATKMVLRDFDGNAIGTFGISHDVTRQVQAEQAAEATSEALAASHAELMKNEIELRARQEELERSTAELERRARELSAVAAVARAAFTDNDVRTAMCVAARDLADAEIVTLLEPDGKGHLTLTGQAGVALPKMSAPLSLPSVVTSVYAKKRVRVVEDLHTDPDTSPAIVDMLEQLVGHRLHGAAYLPLVIDGRCLGVLTVTLAHAASETPQLLQVLEILAQEAATALDRADLHRRLQEQATHDVLTGLSNRRAILDLLDQAIARARRHNRGLGLLYLDLDGFKTVNDTYGHAAGDSVLVEVASRLKETTRLEDHIGRIGGDEFVVICEDLSGEGGALKSRMADAITRPYGALGVELPIGVSIGLAIWGPDDDADALLGRADHAMYADKAARGAWPGSLPSSAVLLPKNRR
ncbi:MAG: diguanylate cyclase domain-containing protein [Acidothermaceae bacterium]